MKLTVRLSNTGVLAIIGVIIAILLAADIFSRPHVVVAPATDRVTAKEFVLTDDSGQTRARIAMNEYGSPCFQLLDKQGQTRAQLRLNRNDVPSLRLYDVQGRARSITGFTLDDMQPSLVMFDENGNGRLVANPDSPSINGKSIFDEDRTWKNDLPSGLNIYTFSQSCSDSGMRDSMILRGIQAQTAQLEEQKARLEAENARLEAEADAARDRAQAAEAEAHAQAQQTDAALKAVLKNQRQPVCCFRKRIE